MFRKTKIIFLIFLIFLYLLYNILLYLIFYLKNIYLKKYNYYFIIIIFYVLEKEMHIIK